MNLITDLVSIMKNCGSTFEYTKERDEDIMRAYLQLIRDCDTIELNDIFRQIVNMPSKRFWVSAERAAIVIWRMIKGDTLADMLPTKREMFTEIYHRVMKLREANPSASIYELTIQVVAQPAPKFYLTTGSAKVIIYKAKKRWYKERRQQLQRLLPKQ